MVRKVGDSYWRRIPGFRMDQKIAQIVRLPGKIRLSGKIFSSALGAFL